VGFKRNVFVRLMSPLADAAMGRRKHFMSHLTQRRRSMAVAPLLVSNLVEANAYSASLEASLTICQVIFPGSFETLIEAEPLDYRPGLQKSLLPVFERSSC
jgi:hypothetical protein